MSITYEHKYDVKNIYDTFKKNRVNVVSYLGTSNNGKLEPDSSAYLSYENLYVNNYTYTYIYARKSSPTIDDDTDKNYAYLKVGDTTYNFYHGHAYTYTETVTGNGAKPILIAYDFVNQISTYLEFDKVSISHNASPINDVPQTVNVFSPISYIIENGENSLDPKNEYSISSSNINTLLDGSTFADFTTYVTYSYLNSEKGDGIVYEDGKDTLSTNPINDIHVWSMSDGVDMRPHKYVDNDTSAVNAYTYLNCGNILNTFFRNNVSNIFDYNSINYKYIKFYYDISVSNTNGVLQQWKAGIVGTDKIYAKDVRTGDNILDYSTFYKVCKVDLPNVSSFNEIYNKPSLRDNSDEINCYININGNSFPGDQEIAYIDKSNNINKSRFVKKINNLPCHLLCKDFKLKIEMPYGMINGGSVTGGGALVINKISVSPVLNGSGSDVLNNEYIIMDGSLQFKVGVKQTSNQNNILYVTSIEENIHNDNLNVITYQDDINVTTRGTSYAELNFNTYNIYHDYEMEYKNTTIKRIDIYGTTDIVFKPNNSSENKYPDGMTCEFGVDYSINNESNTFYTGDFHITVKQTDSVNKTVSEQSSITFSLPGE